MSFDAETIFGIVAGTAMVVAVVVHMRRERQAMERAWGGFASRSSRNRCSMRS